MTGKAFQKCSNVKLISPKLYRIDNLFFRFFKRRPVAFLLSKLSHAVVHIGGSIFIEPKRWDSNDYRLPKAARFYLGSNFGPYRTEFFLENVERRLSIAKDVCFRDTYSYKLFSHLHNVRYAPDIMFGYSNYPDSCPGEYLGISLLDLEHRGALAQVEKPYFDFLSRVIAHYYQKGV